MFINAHIIGTDVNNVDINTIGSYFWQRSSVEYRNWWKLRAKYHNVLHNLTGKKKIGWFLVF